MPTAQGLKLREIVKNLTGAERPIFNQGYGNSGLQNVVWAPLVATAASAAS